MISEKGDGEYKLSVSSGHEVRKIRPWSKADFEVFETGQSQACYHCKQHSTTEVRLRSRHL
jgi:hypothetical protein